MNRKKSVIDERRAGLLEMIRHANGAELDVEQTAKLLGVSPVTLRRDLNVLAEQGTITRGYGRIAPVEQSPQSRITAVNDAIARIARRAAEFVEAGDILFINTSRTALQLIQYINVPNVTVITNNVLATNMPHRSDLTLILTGGEVRYPKYAMVGDVAQKTLQSVTATKAFLGCSGFSLESGMTTEYYGEAAVNNAMMTNVRGPVYMLAGRSKLNWTSSFVSGGADLVSVLITERGAAPDVLTPFRCAGITVYTV